MRLTVFGPGFPLRGGIATTTTAMVRELQDRGHQVQFLTPLRQYPGWLFPGGKEKDPQACPRVTGARAVFAPLEPWTWFRARRRALDFDADVWLVPYWTWVWAPFWLFLLRGFKKRRGPRHIDQPDGADRTRPPAIAVVHNLNDHDGGGFRRWTARQVLVRCQGFLTHAEVLKAALETQVAGSEIASYPLPAIPTEQPLPPRENARRRYGIGDEERLALFLGIVRPYKGVDVLLQAFALLPENSRWRLLVAGEPWGGLDKTLNEKVLNLGIGETVDLRFGWVSEAEVESMFSAADMVVLPYLTGSQSAVAPMALCRGLPVLSTNVGGLGEVIEDGVSGLLVEPNSPEALARAFEAMNDECLADLAGGAAAAAARWTWSGYAEVVEGLIEAVRCGRS